MTSRPLVSVWNVDNSSTVCDEKVVLPGVF
jgi:hypothetical protein